MNKKVYKTLEIKGNEEQLKQDLNYANETLKEISKKKLNNCYQDAEEMINDLRGLIESIATNVLGE